MLERLRAGGPAAPVGVLILGRVRPDEARRVAGWLADGSRRLLIHVMSVGGGETEQLLTQLRELEGPLALERLAVVSHHFRLQVLPRELLGEAEVAHFGQAELADAWAWVAE